jgi:hypothetical protein
VYDPVKREWEPLGAEMAHTCGNNSTVAVAGGLLVVASRVLALGGALSPELYDEGSGRWLTLPHAMVEQRGGTGLASVPASA